jgi:two-component system response regulator CpxR
MHKLLLIESETKGYESLQPTLESAGFEVERVRHPRTGLDRVHAGEHSMVILQLAEPGGEMDFIQALRTHSQIPLVLVCAGSSEIDRILCIESGADEYLSQPFHPRELVARVRAIFRRSSGDIAAQPERIVMGPLELDSASRSARLSGTPIELTNVEFNVLEILLRRSGRVVSREYLAQSVLGRAFRHYDRSIDMHVSRVRKKLGDNGSGKGTIRTIRNVGYMLTRISQDDESARTNGMTQPTYA